MTERSTAQHETHAAPDEPTQPKPLVERAPDDAVEPALNQSGNPPRAFPPPER